jgi:hypothetical protein
LTAISAAEASLLNTVISGLAPTAVDTYAELAALAAQVNRVVGTASSDNLSNAPSLADLTALGVSGVTAANLAVVQQAIASATAGQVDSLSELQSVVTAATNAYTAALGTISSYAQSNGGTAPTTSTFAQAGVTGVDSANLAAIQSALASTAITGTLADTTTEVQTMVDVFNRILAEANGTAADSTAGDPTVADYQAIGVSLGAIATNPSGLALLNDSLGAQTPANVDSVAELNALAATVNSLLTTAAGGTGSPVLTAADLAQMGLTGLTDSALAVFLQLVAATADDGSGLVSLSQLQSLADTAMARADALGTIGSYAQANGFCLTKCLTKFF